MKEIEGRVRAIVGSDTFVKLGEQQQMALRIFVDTLDGKIEER